MKEYARDTGHARKMHPLTELSTRRIIGTPTIPSTQDCSAVLCVSDRRVLQLQLIATVSRGKTMAAKWHSRIKNRTIMFGNAFNYPPFCAASWLSQRACK
jgi:hypothetical protein